MPARVLSPPDGTPPYATATREHSRGEVTPGMRAECGATDLVVAVAG
jgi:hypothetical protein